jgi:hypothetical protein
MDTIEKLIQRVQKTQRGFLDIQKAADEVFAGHAAKVSLRLAKQLFVSDIYQARSLATFIFGRLAANSNESIVFLKERVSMIVIGAYKRFLQKPSTGFVQILDIKMHCRLSRNGWHIPIPIHVVRLQRG